MDRVLKILILEDDRDDAFLIEKILQDNGFDAQFTHVATKEEYENAVKSKYIDIILSDHRMVVYTSREALQYRNECLPSAIFILVTGAVSEEFAVQILKEGADDYVLKTKMQRLTVAIKNALHKKELEASASKAKERFELSVAASKDVIVDYDYLTKTMYVSKAFEKYGYPSGEDQPLDAIFKHIHPDDVDLFLNRYYEFINNKEERFNHFFRLIEADGSIAYINLSSIMVVDSQHRTLRIVSVLHDTTDIRRLQNSLEETELQHQKNIAQTTVEAQEKERQELATELHDNIGQLLVTAKLMLETGMQKPELLEKTLPKTHEIILTAVKETRNLSHSIMPPTMDEQIFLQKIKETAHAISSAGKLKIKCVFPEPDQLKAISNFSKLAIYRIIQEQLTNIVKYSKATEATIQIKMDGFIDLVVQDNGIGFDTKQSSKGLGLTNIRNRAAILNGSMEISSLLGQGTKLTVHIPFVKN